MSFVSGTKRISYDCQHRAHFCMHLIASSNKNCHHNRQGTQEGLSVDLILNTYALDGLKMWR